MALPRRTGVARACRDPIGSRRGRFSFGAVSEGLWAIWVLQHLGLTNRFRVDAARFAEGLRYVGTQLCRRRRSLSSGAPAAIGGGRIWGGRLGDNMLKSHHDHDTDTNTVRRGIRTREFMVYTARRISHPAWPRDNASHSGTLSGNDRPRRPFRHIKCNQFIATVKMDVLRNSPAPVQAMHPPKNYGQ